MGGWQGFFLSKKEVQSYVRFGCTISVLLFCTTPSDKDGEYEIYKNGEKIGSTSKTKYVDDSVKAGEEYKYNIKVQTEVTEERKNQIVKEVTESGSEPSEEVKQKMFRIIGNVGVQVKVPELSKDALSSLVASSASLPSGTDDFKFRYSTFIPNAYIYDPNLLENSGKVTYLLGDDRPFFSFNADEYRSRLDVTTAFFSGGGDMNYDRDFGLSVRCDVQGNPCPSSEILETDTAPDSGIDVDINEEGSRQIRWDASQDQGVPFGASYPNVNWQYNASLSRTAFAVDGAHDQAPSHEFFVSDRSNGQIDTIYTYDVGSFVDFALLAPGIPQVHYSQTIYK